MARIYGSRAQSVAQYNFYGSAEVETPMVYRKLNDSAALSALDISLPISLSNPGKK
jgi:hypothetical protein